MIPMQIMNLIAAHVGMGRIRKFMDAEEMDTPIRPAAGLAAGGGQSPADGGDTKANGAAANGVAVHVNGTASYGAASNGAAANGAKAPAAATGAKAAAAAPAIRVSGGSFAWAPGGPPALSGVDLQIPRGALAIVVGPVGCGKSSLLAALLGEMVPAGPGGGGGVAVEGAVAYTAQDPWIQNATLRNNILMGLPFEAERYQRTLDVACLNADLETLPAGDESEIGEKGINLSGGQKHRVALGRAVYAAADVYLMDDPLSAVDAHVGRHLFEECVCGQLAGATRLLVTHQLQLLPRADLVIVMLDGRTASTPTNPPIRPQTARRIP
ncbi:MAG: P-loop containing nucleoside triphosphate hydrolase protein, partial [Monoraphidium minutum]